MCRHYDEARATRRSANKARFQSRPTTKVGVMAQNENELVETGNAHKCCMQNHAEQFTHVLRSKNADHAALFALVGAVNVCGKSNNLVFDSVAV